MQQELLHFPLDIPRIMKQDGNHFPVEDIQRKNYYTYKNHNNLVLDPLKQIFPSTRGSLSRNNTIHVTQVLIPYRNVDCKFSRNLAPDVINQWNLLKIEAREAFKKICKHNHLIFQLEIIHTKLRHNCILNNDLFWRNIIGSPL